MTTINNREELFTWIRENIQQIDRVWIDTLESDGHRIRICSGTERGNVRKVVSFPAMMEVYPMELDLEVDHIYGDVRIMRGKNTWLAKTLMSEMLKRNVL